MIVIHAYLKVNTEKREQFLDHAQNVIEHSKAEEGNNHYHLYEDTKDLNTFIFVEEWKDQAALDLHEETAHFKQFVGPLEDFLIEPIFVERYEVSKKE